MELSVIFPKESTKQPLQIVKKIGQGKFTVYQAHSPSKKTTYALKAFPKDSYGTTQFQKEALLNGLSHPSIIESIPIAFANPGNSSFHALLTEFAKYGDFFQLVVGSVINKEVLMRTYFRQLIEGVEYMHSKGIAHLDLKLENLMMGSGFNLKIIDFDQAQKVTDKKLTSGGTKGFRAPEVIDGSCKDFVAADIYAAGIILYAFKAQEYPFAENTDKNNVTTLKYYNTFMRDNEAYWEIKAGQKKDKNFFSESFKELIKGMLHSDVVERFTIQDIKDSEWYKGQVLDSKSLEKEMKIRWENFVKDN